MIKLREHQLEAKRRIIHACAFSARNALPAQGARATVVSATGSGKTYTAASAALDLFRNGRILVMLPTLDLLVQTAQAWRRIGHAGPMVGVCSLENDDVLTALGVRTTTNPVQLALWAGSGPVVVLATYASLVDRDDAREPGKRIRGPLETALAGGDLMYAQQLRPFDLAVVDEAHGTAGDLGRPWAAIHDQNRIQAGFRLYLTATPRILAPARPLHGHDGEELAIATMASDPDGVYGERIYDLGLSEAIEKGILAPFEIDVLEIEDPDYYVGVSEDAVRGRRLALLQAALLEHAARWNLRTVMTFHQQVEEAAAFAENLPQTAADLYDTEVSEHALLEADARPSSTIGAKAEDLEAFRHVPPDRVWAQWLCGDHPVAHRRETLRQFANGIGPKGRRVHRAFLASVKVLGEGVDIVGERGVEGICIVGARGSMVQIVQNIGRGLRPNPDGSNKTCRIIVPIFLAPGENPADMVASASYQPLVDILQGLRSHDENIVEQLASRALTRQTPARKKRHVTSSTTGDGEGEETEEPQPEISVLMNFASPRDPASIAAFVRTRVILPDSVIWLRGYQALRRWRAENEITGRYAVPYDTTIDLGPGACFASESAESGESASGAFPLGRWVHEQRRAYRQGSLHERRREQLEAEGMVWEPGDEAWETKLAALRSYHRATGHLAPKQDTVWDDNDGSGPQPIGQLLVNLRRPGGLGKKSERAQQRAEQLAAIDPDWNAPWPLDWQRHYAILRDLAAGEPGGLLPPISPGLMFENEDLGKWLHRQQLDWHTLSEEQQQRLTALGIQPSQRPAADTRAAAGEPGKLSPAFRRGITALAQYVAREGTHRVPRGHAEEISVDGEPEPVTVRLGVWISNVRSRRDKLTGPQRHTLTELGIDWA
ncbi:Helicase associated domain protein [Streptomyces sp. MS1.AVA.4]|uniref:Helicase associated domain protein n=1 Tax=Streptomyces pratisoli TaxID=3139917 RepID=A0ACC6QV88_9ACTN